jgi:hypothetical protein
MEPAAIFGAAESAGFDVAGEDWTAIAMPLKPSKPAIQMAEKKFFIGWAPLAKKNHLMWNLIRCEI